MGSGVWPGSGSLSTAQTQKLAALDTDAWFTNQWTAMKAAVPALTDSIPYKFGPNPIGASVGAVTADASVVGGGMTGLGGTGRTFGVNTLFTPKTGSFAFAFRAKFAALVTARTAQVGFSNTANDKILAVSTRFDTDATNYLLQLTGAAGTVRPALSIAATAAYRNFLIAGNATNLRVWVDGVLGLTHTDFTNTDDAGYAPYLFNTTASDVIIVKALFGYIAP